LIHFYKRYYCFCEFSALIPWLEVLLRKTCHQEAVAVVAVVPGPVAAAGLAAAPGPGGPGLGPDLDPEDLTTTEEAGATIPALRCPPGAVIQATATILSRVAAWEFLD